MKKLISDKKIIAVTTAALILITVITYVAFVNKCFSSSCGSELIRGIIKPLIWFGITATSISIFFLFFPQTIFVSWLKQIASWYLPVLFILTVTTPVYSGHVMSVDRGVVVLWGMIVLGLISVVYALVMKNKV